jgi:hypothetical protein
MSKNTSKIVALKSLILNNVKFVVAEEEGVGTDYMARLDNTGRALLLNLDDAHVTISGDTITINSPAEGVKMYRRINTLRPTLDGENTMTMIQASYDNGLSWSRWHGSTQEGDKIRAALVFSVEHEITVTIPNDFDFGMYDKRLSEHDLGSGWEGYLRDVIFERARWEFENIMLGWEAAREIRRETGEQKHRRGSNSRIGYDGRRELDRVMPLRNRR